MLKGLLSGHESPGQTISAMHDQILWVPRLHGVFMVAAMLEALLPEHLCCLLAWRVCVHAASRLPDRCRSALKVLHAVVGLPCAGAALLSCMSVMLRVLHVCHAEGAVCLSC
jgi:hypothetical protein